jgi:hypothetical protein
MGTRHRKIDTDNIGYKTQKNRHVYLSVSCTQCYPCLSLCVFVPNGSRGYLSVSCAQMVQVSICVLCPMLPVASRCVLWQVLPVSIVMCPCAQCYTCLSFCVLNPMLPVSTLGTRHRKIDTGNIGYKTQKDRHG